MKKNRIKLIAYLISLGILSSNLTACGVKDSVDFNTVYSDDSLEKEYMEYIELYNKLDKLNLKLDNVKLDNLDELDSIEVINNKIDKYNELSFYENKDEYNSYLIQEQIKLNSILTNNGIDDVYNAALNTYKDFFKEYFSMNESDTLKVDINSSNSLGCYVVTVYNLTTGQTEIVESIKVKNKYFHNFTDSIYALQRFNGTYDEMLDKLEETLYYTAYYQDVLNNNSVKKVK